MNIPFASESGRFKSVHGMKGTRFYKVYESLKARCENKNNNRYYAYGARGIRVEWKDFVSFRDDMYESYLAHVSEFGEKQTTIDRIDPDKSYSKKNCQWATSREQNLNKKSGVRLITHNGKTQHLCEWAEELGIEKRTLWSRLKRKWPLSKALTSQKYGHS